MIAPPSLCVGRSGRLSTSGRYRRAPPSRCKRRCWLRMGSTTASYTSRRRRKSLRSTSVTRAEVVVAARSARPAAQAVDAAEGDVRREGARLRREAERRERRVDAAASAARPGAFAARPTPRAAAAATGKAPTPRARTCSAGASRSAVASAACTRSSRGASHRAEELERHVHRLRRAPSARRRSRAPAARCSSAIAARTGARSMATKLRMRCVSACVAPSSDRSPAARAVHPASAPRERRPRRRGAVVIAAGSPTRSDSAPSR